MNKKDYLPEISIRITELFGLNFPENQHVDLQRRLIAAAKELKYDSTISAIFEWLSKPKFSNLELKTITGHLTTGETYFFREKPALELFVHQIIPKLVQHRRGNNEQIRIWCAGCSSGEEPYTLAILLKEHFPELNDWKINILATDISHDAIQKALLGEYTDWSFRETEPALKNKYFTPSGKKWRIVPELKKMVTFSYLNLSQSSYPSSITDTEEVDVLFCRNVMMYFTPQVIQEVSARFKDALCENGWLITSQVELNDAYFSNFERINYNNGIFYQKTDKPLMRPIENNSSKLPVRTIQILGKKIEPKKNIERIGKAAPSKKLSEKAQADSEDPFDLFQKGQYLRCIEHCLHSISNKKMTNNLFSILVHSYANSGLLTDGEKVIAKIMETNHATPEMYYIYATFLNEQHNLEKTEQNLKKAIYLNHKHVLSHLMLGNVFKKNGKRNLAIKHYETTLALLSEYNENEIVPESEGMTAGRIKELTEQIINQI